MTDTIQTNGNGEQSAREREIAGYLAKQSEDRDAFAAEVARLKVEIAGYKVALEAKDAQISEMESRMASAYAVRDEAVAKREQYLSVCMSINALMNTFQIPASPLVREVPEEESPTIGGA